MKSKTRKESDKWRKRQRAGKNKKVAVWPHAEALRAQKRHGRELGRQAGTHE